jgi:hypothetical protein
MMLIGAIVAGLDQVEAKLSPELILSGRRREKGLADL